MRIFRKYNLEYLMPSEHFKTLFSTYLNVHPVLRTDVFCSGKKDNDIQRIFLKQRQKTFDGQEKKSTNSLIGKL